MATRQDPQSPKPKVKQVHTPEGPAEEFINEYDSEIEHLPEEKQQTRSSSPGENRGHARENSLDPKGGPA